jgi:hypothetical protein
VIVFRLYTRTFAATCGDVETVGNQEKIELARLKSVRPLGNESTFS